MTKRPRHARGLELLERRRTWTRALLLGYVFVGGLSALIVFYLW